MTPQTLHPHPLAPATQERLTAAQTEATRPGIFAQPGALAPTGIGAHDASAPVPVGAAQAPRPTLATATRYPALSGCPDLTDHAQLVEAIGYAERARRLSKRQRWSRVERMAINAAVAYVQTDARTSLDRALQLWSEIQAARGMQLLDDAQDADVARKAVAA